MCFQWQWELTVGPGGPTLPADPGKPVGPWEMTQGAQMLLDDFEDREQQLLLDNHSNNNMNKNNYVLILLVHPVFLCHPSVQQHQLAPETTTRD